MLKLLFSNEITTTTITVGLEEEEEEEKAKENEEILLSKPTVKFIECSNTSSGY